MFRGGLTSLVRRNACFCKMALTIFGTCKNLSQKIFDLYLHTYIILCSPLKYWLLHYVGSLHKIKSTYINRPVFIAFLWLWHVISLYFKVYRLTSHQRNKLVHWLKQFVSAVKQFVSAWCVMLNHISAHSFCLKESGVLEQNRWNGGMVWIM